MNNLKYPSGFFFNKPHENAPDFVLGTMAIRPDVFIEWLKEQKPNEHGYVRLQALAGKEDGKAYCVIDNYVKTQESAPQEASEEDNEGIDASSIPF